MPGKFATITVTDAVVGLVDLFPTLAALEADFMVIQVEGGELRYRWDGEEDPDTDTGMLLKSSDPPLVLESRSRINAFRMCRNDVADVVVSVTIDNRDD